jgi:leucyl/phenylalanyl-tRNA--protein transferase
MDRLAGFAGSRGILPLDTFHVPSRLARVMRHNPFEVSINRAFEGVMRAARCGGRWDVDWVRTSCRRTALHRWSRALGGVLAGRAVSRGLYGVHLCGAFFGESMFHRETDASKVALVTLVDRLHRRSFSLLDTQWINPHLVQFGGVEIPRAEYLRQLRGALRRECTFD